MPLVQMVHGRGHNNGQIVQNTAEDIAQHDADVAAGAVFMEAQVWKAIRAERDKRLVESDISQMPDVTPPGGKPAWTTYRQALRDLPGNTADPHAFYAAWLDFINSEEGATDPWPAKPA
jgi:hypothetical protein